MEVRLHIPDFLTRMCAVKVVWLWLPGIPTLFFQVLDSIAVCRFYWEQATPASNLLTQSLYYIMLMTHVIVHTNREIIMTTSALNSGRCQCHAQLGFWMLLEVQHCQMQKHVKYRSIATQLPSLFLGLDSVEFSKYYDLILSCSDLQWNGLSHLYSRSHSCSI